MLSWREIRNHALLILFQKLGTREGVKYLHASQVEIPIRISSYNKFFSQKFLDLLRIIFTALLNRFRIWKRCFYRFEEKLRAKEKSTADVTHYSTIILTFSLLNLPSYLDASTSTVETHYLKRLLSSKIEGLGQIGFWITEKTTATV